jgi:hypothetical protein
MRGRSYIELVIAGLDPAIHLFARRWMRGSSPRITGEC